MENQVLNLLVKRLGSALVGSRVTGAYAAREGVVLSLESSPLFLCLRKELPLLMAREQAEARQPSAAYGTMAARMRDRLADAALAAVEKDPSDRLVVFRFQHPERGVSLLHFVAIPRRVDLVLTGTERKTIAGLEAPVGEAYTPPAAPPGELDFHSAGPEELRAAMTAIAAAEDRGKAARRLLKGAGPELAAELAALLEADSERALELLLELRELRFQAGIFSSSPGDESALILLPGVYRHFAGEPLELFEDPNDAAEVLFRKRMRATALAVETTTISSMLKKRRKRLEQLISNLAGDLVRSEREIGSGALGDLILANLRSIKRGVASVEVDDIFKGEGRIVIELDPALEPPANAERYYKRARKAKRAARSIRKRLAELEGERSELADLERRLDESRQVEDLKGLRALHGRLVEIGWLAPARRKRGKVVSQPGRRFISSDGLEIVVGRNNRDNEAVTFGIGKEYDFWFHSAGYAGSHVLVRNPKRLKQLPPATMAEAASIAAYYSKARQSRNVQVHWTERRFLKKAKGGDPGKVLLTSYRAVTADPEIPPTVRVP
jgi:predicted ribosome quality control (RQC) complex YloA/Tae2 family protein